MDGNTDSPRSTSGADGSPRPRAQESHLVPAKKWWSINRRLLPIKGYYFLFVAAVGDLLPFIAIYMKYLGLSSGETGIIYGIMPFIAFFFRPLLGALADKFHAHKLVLIVTTVLSGVFYMLLLAVPAKYDHVSGVPVRLNIHCNNYDSYIRDCREYVGGDAQRCQLTFTEYANLTLVDEGYGNASRWSDDSEKTCESTGGGGGDDEVVCTAKCQSSEAGAFESKVCFREDVASFNDQKCVNMWVSSTSDEYLEFTVLNVTNLMMHEIKGGNQHELGLDCRDYDFKWVEYKGNKYWHMICGETTILHCNLHCNKIVPNRCQSHGNVDSFGKTFWLFFLIHLLAQIAFAPTFSLIDAMTYDNLGKERNRWGFQRLFGTVGFGLFAVTSAFIMDTMQEQNKDIDFSISFYIFGLLCFLSAVTAKFITVSSHVKSGKFLKNICKLFSYCYITAFLFVILCFGILTGAIEGFLFWFMLDLCSSRIVLGLCLAVNCISEVFCLSVSGHVIGKIGHVPCMYLACLAYAVRFLCYSFLQNPWYVLLVELIHGVNYGIMWAAVSSYASIIAPPGMKATIQGLVGGLHFGFGKGIGSLMTGYMFEVIGERWTFRTLSVAAVVIFVVYFALNTFVIKPPSIVGREEAEHIEDSTEDSVCAVQNRLLESNPGSKAEMSLEEK